MTEHGAEAGRIVALWDEKGRRYSKKIPCPRCGRTAFFVADDVWEWGASAGSALLPSGEHPREGNLIACGECGCEVIWNPFPQLWFDPIPLPPIDSGDAA